jgi:rubrerythrin
MELSSFQISKIELVAEFESAVMELYWMYSEKFPEHETFWISMADDERKNTEWVRSTIEKIKGETIEYNRDRFNIEAIRSTLNFVKSQIQAVQSKPVTLQNALGNAAGIEDSLAKKRFYEIIKDDNPEGRQLYQKFIAENQKHREKLNQFRQKNK